MEGVQRLGRPFEVIAHRGASASAPEHTHEAYDLALAQGADALELDVRATRDGELLVVHDATLARTAGDPRRVDQLTRADLDRMAPHRRPLSLDAVLERYGRAARVLVELKAPEPRWEGVVVDAVERHEMADRVELLAFDRIALRRLHLRAPGLPLVSLHRGRPSARALETVARFAAGVGVWQGTLGAGVVAAAHARGLFVRTWTVNSRSAVERVASLGVDGVITDVPNIVVAARTMAPTAGRRSRRAVAA